MKKFLFSFRIICSVATIVLSIVTLVLIIKKRDAE